MEGRPGLCIMCVLYFYTRQHASSSTSTNGFCRCCSLNCPLALTRPVLYSGSASCHHSFLLPATIHLITSERESCREKSCARDGLPPGQQLVTHTRVVGLHPIITCWVPTLRLIMSILAQCLLERVYCLCALAGARAQCLGQSLHSLCIIFPQLFLLCSLCCVHDGAPLRGQVSSRAS